MRNALLGGEASLARRLPNPLPGVRLPGTLKALLAQVKASPVPIGSISVPTGENQPPLTITFGEAPAPMPKAPERNKLTESKPLRARDTVGAFQTIPQGREEPWAPVGS